MWSWAQSPWSRSKWASRRIGSAKRWSGTHPRRRWSMRSTKFSRFRQNRAGERFLCLAGVLLLIVGLSAAHAELQKGQENPKTTPDNVLTKKEKKDGWILLFDGKSLDGWMTSSHMPG